MCCRDKLWFSSAFPGCNWWPLWRGLSFGGPGWRNALQGNEKAVRQFYLHSIQERDVQVLLQQWVLHLHAQDRLLWLPGRWRPSALPQREQSHRSYSGATIFYFFMFVWCKEILTLDDADMSQILKWEMYIKQPLAHMSLAIKDYTTTS